MTLPSKHKRGKTGCITCRIRRIKCDEEKPSCRRCYSTGRKCDGYTAPTIRTVQQSLSIIVRGPIEGGCNAPSRCAIRARISFQMFKDLFAPALSGYGTSAFWQHVVLQASDRSEAIKHLVIAATNLRHAPIPAPADGTEMVEKTGFSQRNNVPFLAHYGRALQVLAQCASSDLVVVLVACVLLAVCDDLQMNTEGAQRHIQAGQRILASQTASPSSGQWGHSMALDEITSTISRLCAPRPVMVTLRPLVM